MPRGPAPRRRLLPLLLLLLSACSSRSTSYPGASLAESVKKICLDEYQLKADARLIGKTLYVSCQLDSLIEPELEMQTDTLEKLEGAMLSVTRAALSTDVPIDYLVVMAREAGLGMMMTLVRYFPDVKGLIYMKYSRDDFEKRLIFELEHKDAPEDPAAWHEITMDEFIVRLIASRVERRFSSNPLLSAFLQIRHIQGALDKNILTLKLDQDDESAKTLKLSEELLKSAVSDVVLDVMTNYPTAQRIQTVRIENKNGRRLLEMTGKDMKTLRTENVKKI